MMLTNVGNLFRTDIMRAIPLRLEGRLIEPTGETVLSLDCAFEGLYQPYSPPNRGKRGS